MDIFQQVHKALQEKYQDGATQQELADAAGISRAYICNLLNGKRKTSALTLENLVRLFPQVTLDLNGALPVRATSPLTEEDEMDSTLLELFHAMTYKDKLNLLIYLSRQTATKATIWSPPQTRRSVKLKKIGFPFKK